MSVENVALAQRALDAWNQNDWATLEQVTHPEGVIAAPEGWPEGGEFEGWAAIRRQFERLKEAWSEERFDVDSIDAVGDDRVLVTGHWRGHGGASGLDADFAMWVVYTVQDGRLIRTDFCLQKNAADAALTRKG